MLKPKVRTVLLLTLICLALGCTFKPNFEIADHPTIVVVEDLTPEQPHVDVGPTDGRPTAAKLLPPLTFEIKMDTVTPERVSLSDLDSVEVGIKLSGAFAGSTLAVEFIAPGDGNTVYERKTKTLEGSVFDEQNLSFQLPVAGTLIDSAKLSGAWTARFELDGVELATQTFELAQ